MIKNYGLANIIPEGYEIIGITICEPWDTSIGVIPMLAITTNNRGINLITDKNANVGSGRISFKYMYKKI